MRWGFRAELNRLFVQIPSGKILGDQSGLVGENHRFQFPLNLTNSKIQQNLLKNLVPSCSLILFRSLNQRP